MRTEPPAGDELTRMLVTMKRNVLEEASRDPAPARRRARNRAIITSTAILLTLGLGAGAAIAAGMIGEDDPPAAQPQSVATSPAPYATPVPRPFLIETEAPVDPLTLVTEIVVRPEGLELTDESGTLVRTLSYEGDGAGTAAVLETVLAEEPVVREQTSSAGTIAIRTFTWDGLMIIEYLERGLHRADTRLWIRADLPVIGDGATVTTSAGFSPGDDLVRYATEAGVPYDPADPSGHWLVPVEHGPELGPRRAGYLNALAVVASTDHDHSPPRTMVTAPFNFAVEDGTN